MIIFIIAQRRESGHRMDVPISWLIIGLCIIGHFFFSASETALTCCNRFKIQVKADEGSKTAKLLIKVCNRFDRALTSVLIGTNIMSIIISAVSTVLFLNILQSSGMTDSTISLISSIAMSFLVYILGDTLPKTIAKAIPDTLSYIFVYPIYFFMIILFPITILFELLVKLIEKIFKVKEETPFDEEDFENVVEKVADEGVIEEEQNEIIQSALDFVDTNVKEVLTPKEKIFALNIRDINHDSLKGILITTRYSRIPIYDRQFDNFIGVLNVKTYFKAIEKNPNVSIRKILQKPYFVSTSIMIDDLFNGFKKNHTHLALVRNSSNKVVGMVTMEDVLEELVSDIAEPSNRKKGNN